MENVRGPRLRILTLRVKRDLFYRLSDQAASAGMSLDDYIHRFVVALAFDRAGYFTVLDQEVSDDA